MSPISRATPAGAAYLDLRSRAKQARRPTQELLQLYVLEGFLARLAASAVHDSFVLKGGVLLAAFNTRRPTKDVDLAGLSISNDTDAVRELIAVVLAVETADDDGIEFFPTTTTAEVIREGADEYSGVRVHVDARLATAKLGFHVDVNVGDPIWPQPMMIDVPRLRGGAPIQLAGYPLHMVHAEKIVTAMQRGTANTRWRDFGDIWTLSGNHTITGSDLQHAIVEVARYRGAMLTTPIADVLDGYAGIAQAKWAAWRRGNRSDHLPAQFADVLTDVLRFAGPALSGTVGDQVWDYVQRVWLRVSQDGQ